MTILVLILLAATIYFEWELVKTALIPLMDVVVAAFFIVMLLIVIVVELALIVVAPTALILGVESRQWHINAARKVMLGGKTDADNS